MNKLNLYSSSFIFAAIICASFGLRAQAQYTTTLRNPLIQGAPQTQAGQAAQPGQAEIPGSGATPIPEIAGMTGNPTAPPSDVVLPPMSALQHFELSSMVQPYLTPSPSTPGVDPGELPIVPGYPEPAAVVPVNQGGGLPNEAPTKRRGGQTTADYGLKRTNGSTLTDFGQLLPNMPNLQAQPQYSQDGPRVTFNGGLTGVNRQPNLTGAQSTQDLYGVRQLFDGNTRPIETIAPY